MAPLNPSSGTSDEAATPSPSADASKQVSAAEASIEMSESGTVLLTDLSVRAIALYQKQAELTDRLWSYFGINCTAAIVVGLAAPILATRGWFPVSDSYLAALLLLLVGAFTSFTIGNRRALLVSQAALQRIAAQAQMASGIELEVIRPDNAASFHKIVTLVVLCAMGTGLFMAYNMQREQSPASISEPKAASPRQSDEKMTLPRRADQ